MIEFHLMFRWGPKCRLISIPLLTSNLIEQMYGSNPRQSRFPSDITRVLSLTRRGVVLVGGLIWDLGRDPTVGESAELQLKTCSKVTT